MKRNIIGTFNQILLNFKQNYVALNPECMERYNLSKGFFTCPFDGKEGNTLYLTHEKMDNTINENSNAKYINSYKGYDYFIDVYEIDNNIFYKYSNK